MFAASYRFIFIANLHKTLFEEHFDRNCVEPLLEWLQVASEIQIHDQS